jgi:drug/metabolite transporter (DMT)-like permease
VTVLADREGARKKGPVVHLMMLLHSAISAGTYLAAKRGLVELGPFELALVRFALAAGIYVALLLRARRAIERRDWPRLALAGLVGVTVNQTLFLSGMRLTSPGHGALIYALTPVFVFLLAWSRLGERATPTKVGGILLAFLGTAVVLLSRGLRELSADSALGGDLLVLLAVLAWSLYTVISKPLAEKYGAIVTTGWALVLGAIIYLPLGLALGDLSRLPTLSRGGWGAVLYLAVVTNAVSWLIYAWALSRTEASRVAVWSNLQPVLTALLAWSLYGEQLTPQFVAGGALVLTGVFLAERSGERPE